MIGAIFQLRHYRSFIQYFTLFDKPLTHLFNYIFNTGTYPKTIKIRSPIGKLDARLYSHHDLLTVNEIFCRDDYDCSHEKKVILDVGSNIGISALYFLSRNSENYVYLFEPNPQNIPRLKANTKKFEKRIQLNPIAVSDRTGEVEFGIEDSGRYGGILSPTEKRIKVNSEGINSVLDRVLARHQKLDILKLDTEGTEILILNAINPKYFENIPVIYFEEGVSERLKLLDEKILTKFRMNENGQTYKLESNSANSVTKRV